MTPPLWMVCADFFLGGVAWTLTIIAAIEVLKSGK